MNKRNVNFKINFNREVEQGQILERIANTNGELGERNYELTNLKQDFKAMESRNYSERKEIEILENEIRQASQTSH